MSNHSQHIRQVSIVCPVHGFLNKKVEYFSINVGNKVLVDLPAVFCKECRNYYTPFANWAALMELNYNGRSILAAQGNVQRSAPKVTVKVPHLVDRDEMRELSNNRVDKGKRISEKAKKEQHRKYIEGLREIQYDSIIITNKECFLKENKCPVCNEKVTKEHIKIIRDWNFITTNVKHCKICDADYISTEQYQNVEAKTNKIIRKSYLWGFVHPKNVIIDGEHHIPKWAYDENKYNQHHLPPKGDIYYDMSEEEYQRVIDFYQPYIEEIEEYEISLKSHSFLWNAGYNTSKPLFERSAPVSRFSTK